MHASRLRSLATALVAVGVVLTAPSSMGAQRRRGPRASPTGPSTSRSPVAPLAPAPRGARPDPRSLPGDHGPILREGPARPTADLRIAHDRCVRSLVRVERNDGAVGSGWVAELAGQRVVVTNAHVVAGVRAVRVHPYVGEAVLAQVRYVSPNIDLAVLIPERELTSVNAAGLTRPVMALAVGSGGLVRGERVVLGGNPGGLFFITTEGVVAGVVSDTHDSDQACGQGHNCVVLDSEGELGSSGGPIVDHAGRVIGMLWGVYTGASLSIAIHASTLQRELDLAALALAHRRTPTP